MYICELSFETSGRDKGNPRIYLMEVDYYNRTPSSTHNEVPNHSLSLRKVWDTKRYEIYRRIPKPPRIAKEIVIFSSRSLKEAIEFGSREWKKYHGTRELDKVCQHNHIHGSMSCPKLA